MFLKNPEPPTSEILEFFRHQWDELNKVHYQSAFMAGDPLHEYDNRQFLLKLANISQETIDQWIDEIILIDKEEISRLRKLYNEYVPRERPVRGNKKIKKGEIFKSEQEDIKPAAVPVFGQLLVDQPNYKPKRTRKKK